MIGYLGKKPREHSKQGSQDVWKGIFYGFSCAPQKDVAVLTPSIISHH